MFKSTPTYDENRLWDKEVPHNVESWNSSERFDNNMENFSEREKLVKKVKTSINNINTIISKLRMNPEFLNTLNKKIKGMPTFDACWILIWEIEKICDKNTVALLEEYRYWVNTAKQDIELMKIIEESLQLCLELGKFTKQNPHPSERKSEDPFWTTFFRPL